jgi:hypothetical protein
MSHVAAQMHSDGLCWTIGEELEVAGHSPARAGAWPPTMSNGPGDGLARFRCPSFPNLEARPADESSVETLKRDVGGWGLG